MFDDVWQVRTDARGKIPLAGRLHGERVDTPIVYDDDGTFHFIEGAALKSIQIDLHRLRDLPVAGE